MDLNIDSLLQIFNNYPTVVNNRNQLVALLKDFFPTQKLYCNIFIVAYDVGIVEEIQKNDLTDLFISRIVKVMVNDYGVVNDLALEAVELWCNIYGNKILGKPVEFGLPKDNKGSDHSEVASKQETLSTAALDKVIIDRKNSKEGQKYPKDVVIRNTPLEKAFGIKNVTLTLREKYDYFCVIGEVEAEDTTKEWLLCCSIYDKSNRLIRYDTCAPVEPNSKNQYFPFEMSFSIPKNIIISKIFLYPMKNPVSEEE